MCVKEEMKSTKERMTTPMRSRRGKNRKRYVEGSDFHSSKLKETHSYWLLTDFRLFALSEH